jgi:hypothetical protein
VRGHGHAVGRKIGSDSQDCVALREKAKGKRGGRREIAALGGVTAKKRKGTEGEGVCLRKEIGKIGGEDSLAVS